MPLTAALVATDDSADILKPEDLNLQLPSAIQSAQRRNCVGDVADKEWQLRRGQLSDTLTQIRQSLCVRTHLLKYKRKNVRGQRPNTRHNSLIDTNMRRTRSLAATYNRAREAMLALDPDRDDWQRTYLPLTDSDLVPLYVGVYSDDDPKVTRKSQKDRRISMRTNSEGKRSVPWIWRAPGVLNETEDELDPETSEQLNEGEPTFLTDAYD